MLRWSLPTLALLACASSTFGQGRFINEVTFEMNHPLVVAITGKSEHIAIGWDTGLLSVFAPNSGKTFYGLPGHTQKVSAVAFSPDDKYVVTTGVDGAVIVWDTQTAYKLCQLKEGFAQMATAIKNRLPAGAPVTGLAFSPDGKKLAVTEASGSVRVWSFPQGKPLFTIKGAHKGIATALAFSPDGAQILTGGADKSLKVWKAAPGTVKPIATMTEHPSPITCVAFSPDGKRYVAGGGDAAKKSGFLKLWSAENHKAEAELEGHPDVVTSVAFHPKLPRVASSGKDGSIRVYSLENRREGFKERDKHRDAIHNLAISADGKTLVTTSNETVKWWMIDVPFDN